jgi:tetratricopeptide (TPR) repeat protein
MSAVFLSYSSDQGDAASRIELSLKEDGHSVFRDRSSLPAGEAYDAQIREAVEDCEIFVFLVSRESVSPGRYTLTELGLAERKWGNPSGHVLPVLIEPIARESIPAFLRAVTMLNPEGNLTAEVAAEVARMSASWWRRMIEPRRLVPALAVVLVLAAIAWLALPTYLERRERAADVTKLVKQGLSIPNSGTYEDGWKSLEKARSLAPMSREVLDAEEQLAMEWVRRNGLGSWTGEELERILDTTLPVLKRAEEEATGARSADLIAHLGWAEYLGDLAGAAGRSHAIDNFRKALDIDSRNVYAHAMWGFEILRGLGGEPEAIDAARKHFSAALESGREREYVRLVEMSALLRTYTQMWSRNPGLEVEAVRVMNDMRVKGEPGPVDSLKRKFWTVYHFEAVSADNLESLRAALPPADHLATFRWAFPENGLSEDEEPSRLNYYYVLAQLQEQAGDRAGAVASYRKVVEAFSGRKPGSRAGSMHDRASAGLKRLSG